ncbi:MAG: DUF2769 domain-containing protein [Actinobacteria bacterium]|nr:DUF2769 domain-containing protein [Actinomycetota bacterium]MBU1944305.1 DUF2769 domain-containing protein [Actinomycetota bacterium]MBU2688290.1 DUF2769 domain-containing protein [Actinomycetota bacterium]
MPVPDTQENMMKCICMTCPTHNQCMKEKMEGFFCAKGKATCEFEKVSCVCATCPIYSEFSLGDSFYCEMGAAQ